MTSVPPTAKTTEPYRETERQTAELAALRRMLHASRECFSLSVAVCNSPALRDYVIGEIRNTVPHVQLVAVPRETVDVFGFVAAETDGKVGSALFVVNLEASVSSERKSHPVLRSLNGSRDLWQQRFPCPVVFWLPEYAATLLSGEAPDFWRYRSHRFEFVSDAARAQAGLSDPFSGDLEMAAALTVEEKRFRLAELEQRIAEAGPSPATPLAFHVSAWLTELGFLHRFLGTLSKAERAFRSAIEIDKRFGNSEGVARNSANLAIVYLCQDDLGRSEQMSLQSLEICEELGHREGVAKNLGNLGWVYYERGDLQRAEETWLKGLQIDEELGDKQGVARHYLNLGSLYQRKHDFARAEDCLLAALKAGEELGQPNDAANARGNLGLLYLQRGDLDRAATMFHEALGSLQQLGQSEGIAAALGNLGLVAKKRGQVSKARDYFTRARDVYQEMSLTHRTAQLDRWLSELPENGG